MKNKFQYLRFYVSFILFTPLGLLGEQKSFPSKEIKSIVIKVPHIDLKITNKSSPYYTVKWTGDLSLQNEKKTLSFYSSIYSQKDFKSSKKPIRLDITGPSAQLKLFAFSSQAVFSRWTKPVFISSFKGSFKSEQSRGHWEISLKEGSVNMNKHQGSLTGKAFNAHYLMTSCKGNFKFHINEGSLNIKKSKGNLYWTTDKAQTKLAHFQGNVTGSSQSGSIQASLQAETVNMASKNGSIRIHFMGGQAPQIKAKTEQGKIYGGRLLHKQFSGKSTTVSGRMKGSVKKGKVSLKSETGNIYLN